MPAMKVSKRERVTGIKVSPVPLNPHPVQEESRSGTPEQVFRVSGRKRRDAQNGVIGYEDVARMRVEQKNPK